MKHFSFKDIHLFSIYIKILISITHPVDCLKKQSRIFNLAFDKWPELLKDIA